MWIYLRILVGVGALLIRVETAQAQLNNRAFTNVEPGLKWPSLFLANPLHEYKVRVIAPDSSAGDLRLSLNSFTFFKDNEYFNKIVDGYTLYGTQLNPQLVYYPVQNLRLEGGVFLWKDFGNPQLQQVRPTFRATWTTGRQPMR